MSILSGFEKQYEYTAVGNDHKKVSKWTSTDTIDLGTYTNKDKTKANSNWDSGYDNTNTQPTKMSEFVGKITAFFNNVKYLKKVHDALETTVNSLTTSVNGAVKTIKMNGASKTPTSGVVDLGTVITSHQSLANYATLTGTPTFTGSPRITTNINTQLSNGNNILSYSAVKSLDDVVLDQTPTSALTGNLETTIHGAYGYTTNSGKDLYITLPINIARQVSGVDQVIRCTIQLRAFGKNGNELMAGYIGGSNYNLLSSGVSITTEVFAKQGCIRVKAHKDTAWEVNNGDGLVGTVINNAPFNGQVNITMTLV